MSHSVFVGFCIRYLFLKIIPQFSAVYGNYDTRGKGGIWRKRQVIIMFFYSSAKCKKFREYMKFCEQA